MENIRPAIYMCTFVVASYFVTHTNGELINRTNCPLTKDGWNERGHEYCKSQPEDYHCMYNTSCKLVEFCRKEKYNNFQIYLSISGLQFFKEKRNEMFTNSMNYWKMQDILYCKNRTWIPKTEKPMISPRTGQPSTTSVSTTSVNTFDTTGQPSTTSQPSTTCDNGANVYLILLIVFIIAI